MSKADHFGQYLGYEVLPPEGPGQLPRFRMTIADRHLSGAGVSHGGAVFSLIDFAMGATLIFQVQPEGQSCSTVGLQIEYLRPVPKGTTLTVHTVIEHQGRSIARLRADAYNQDGKKVALATGTFNIYTPKKR